MCAYIPLGEPRKDWITYFDDGSYEPVDPDGNLNMKPMDRRKPEWMVVGEKPDWRPEKYSNTKRGQKAKRELGTKQQSQQTNQSQSLFAPQKTTPKATGTGTNTGTDSSSDSSSDSGTGTKSLPGFGGVAWPKVTTMPDLSGNSGFSGQTNKTTPKRTVPSSLMTASMDEITGLLAGIDKRKTAGTQQGQTNQPNQLNRANKTAATSNFLAGTKAGAGPQKKSPLPAPNPPKEKDDRQPQYRLTGKASVQLGGPDDGKVTMLTDDLMPIAEKPERSSAQDVAGMKQAEKRQQAKKSANDARGLNKAERKQHNARTDVDRRTENEKRIETQKSKNKTYAELLTKSEEADWDVPKNWDSTKKNKDAQREMSNLLDQGTKWSSIRKDLEAVLKSDDSSLSQKEKAVLTRKVVELADIAIPSIQADALAFMATIGDIHDSDVSTLRKVGAHAINVGGLLGAVPWVGPLVDIGAYETIGWLLTNPETAQILAAKTQQNKSTGK